MRIVFDHSGRQISSDIGRWVARLIGALLVCVGLTATVIAIPSGFVVVVDVINTFQPQPEDLFEPGFPLREIEAAFVASAVTAFAGIRYGRRLFRGTRQIVLFLRRFGYDGSMQVVTYAVAETIGVSWRLVTLDDDEIAPVGVDTTSRVVFGTGERLVNVAKRVGSAVIPLYGYSIWGICGVIALQVLVVWPDWRSLLEDGTVDRYAAIFGSVMEGRIPIAYYELSLPGAFAVLMTGVGIGMIGLFVSFVTMLALFPLFGFFILATSAAEAVRKAEQQKEATITEPNQVRHMAAELSRRASETFAPRLIVVRVAGAIWQQTVTALAGVAAATIVDVSEPTDNLAWEIQELDRLDTDDRCIFIVDHARIADNAGTDAGVVSAMAQMVGNRAVLAYTTDRAGMRRFARALHGKLLDLPPRPISRG